MLSNGPSCIVRALTSLACVLGTLALLAEPAQAQRRERVGKEVVEAVCGPNCHSTGKDKAPRIGNAKAWAPRASQGLRALTEHAITGIRKMPSHGGNPGVSDLEIERAIVYMVNRSGGRWIEPVGGASPALLRTSESVVKAKCLSCHQTGQDGAPKIGDRQAWLPRLSKGLDTLVASAVHGHGAMPARGGLPDLSDAEIRGATIYMFNYGLPEPPPPAPAESQSPNHKLVGGMDVYFGLVKAESLTAGQVPGQAEIPRGKNFYHLNISVVDHGTHVPVTDAVVSLRVSDGMSIQSGTLGLVAANNAVSYGGFFRLTAGNSYTVTADIQRPGVNQPQRVSFNYKAR